MSDPSGPPPGAPSTATAVVALAAPGGLRGRLLGRRGPQQVTFTREEIVVEHADALQAPLRFAPGSVVAASVDPGAQAVAGRDIGRFPVLHRLGPKQVIPRTEGIEGWLWTSAEPSAFTVLGDGPPNLAFLFSPPLSGEAVEAAFDTSMLAELARRAPLGEPAVFGLLLQVESPEAARKTIERWNLPDLVTDREVPPVQRRHLPHDRPANPTISGLGGAGPATSKPPPGMG